MRIFFKLLLSLFAVETGIKALFTSGYTADIVHKKGILEEGTDFITKPIIPQELILKVREILSR
ncbi:MAG: hypothetical protein AABZ10_02890 [Nitrospirota bacterium]